MNVQPLVPSSIEAAIVTAANFEMAIFPPGARITTLPVYPFVTCPPCGKIVVSER
jgi:hypothetical protein